VTSQSPAVAGWHASKPAGERASPLYGDGDDVPAEVSELLVDALESHGGVCMWWCVWAVLWSGGSGSERKRVELQS
jgi:hypothetical protein